MMMREAAEFVIDKRHQLMEGRVVTAAPDG